MVKQYNDSWPFKLEDRSELIAEASSYIDRVTERQKRLLSISDLWKGYTSTHTTQVTFREFELAYKTKYDKVN